MNEEVQWYELPKDGTDPIGNAEAFARIGVRGSQMFFAIEAFGLSLPDFMASLIFHEITNASMFMEEDTRGLSGIFASHSTIRAMINPNQRKQFDNTIKELWGEIYKTLLRSSYATSQK